MKWIGGENTAYGKKLQKISKELGSDFTVRDIWAWDKYKSKYKDKHEDEYWRHVISDVRGRTLDREFVNSKNILTVSTRLRGKWRRIKRFLDVTKS